MKTADGGPPAGAPSPGSSARRAPLYKNPWVWGVIGMIALDSLFRFTPLLKQIPDPPPVQSTLGEFRLIDQNGEPFGPGDLTRTIHIVGFFFTSCSTVCPALMGTMKELEETMTVQEQYEKYGYDLRLMAISVDPETDTPERLAETMEKYDLDPKRWTLLTGEPEAIREVVEGGFGTAMGIKEEIEPGLFDIAHSGRLAMLDEDGGVRGFYSVDEAGLDEIFWLSIRTLRDQRIRASKAERRSAN